MSVSYFVAVLARGSWSSGNRVRGVAVFGVALLAWSSVAIACMGIASPSATLTGMFSRMPPAQIQSSAQEKDAPIRHGFGRF